MTTRRRTLAMLFLAAASLDCCLSAAADAGRRPLTASDVIETRRPLDMDPIGAHQVFLSPDGLKYATILTQGDLRRDGYWVEILVGRTTSWKEAQPRVVARLFTPARRDERIGLLASSYPGGNRFIWLADSEHLAFLWSDGVAPTQVRVLDVRTGRMQWITHHPTSVLRFGISADGRELVYFAYPLIPPDENARLLREGFAIKSIDYSTFSMGDLAGRTPWDKLEPYFLTVGKPARRIRFESGLSTWRAYEWPSVSPDGRIALIHRVADPDAADNVIETDQLMAIDLRTGMSRTLFDVGISSYSGTKVVWSADGSRAAVGAVIQREGMASGNHEPSEVAVIDLRSIKDISITPLKVPHSGLRPVSWCDDGSIELRDGEESLRLKRASGEWHVEQDYAGRQCVRSSDHRLTIEWREDPNTAPALFAVDRASGRAKMILDPDPRLRRDFLLGHVNLVEWQDSDGKRWDGLLYHPVGFSTHERYPLVVEMLGAFSGTRFSLRGGGDQTTAAAAQVLAGRGIAVLVLDSHAIGGSMGTPEEPVRVMRGVEGAIRYLTDVGIVDPKKVGILGYSRTGWWVEYMLTHSRVPIAAAISADGLDISYVQLVLTAEPGRYKSLIQSVGAAPFGAGLSRWLESAPGFNADKVHTPLRLELASGGVPFAFAEWEMYCRLKKLSRPVEYFVDPDARHADHPLQVPSQQLSSMQGTVDWMDFWLNGRESSDPAKRDQYARWRVLRQQQLAAAAAH